MKKFIAITAIILLIFSCRKHDPFSNLKWNEETFLKFDVKNISDTTFINVNHFNIVPYYSHLMQRVVIPEDGNYQLSFKCSPFNKIELSFRNSIIPLFALPGDTLTIHLDFDYNKEVYSAVSFAGITEKINTYLLNKTQYFNYFDIGIPASNFNSPSFSIYEGSEKIDSMYNEELKYLSAYIEKIKLPDWFIEMERQNIFYGNASFKMSAIPYRNYFHGESTGRNDKYFQFLDTISVNNISSAKSVNYYFFLGSYYFLNNKLLNEKLDMEGNARGFERAFPLFLAAIDDVKKQLDGIIREWYFAHKFSRFYFLAEKKSQLEKIDSLFATVKPFFSDTVLYHVVKNTKRQDINLEQTEFLNAGEAAPDFYLGDVTGNFHSLKKSGENVVFLNFWASWCAPCIKEIPEKNAMIKRFEGKKVIFLNISLDKNREDWLDAIDEHHFLGTHLICKGNWEELLHEKYYITGIPHYALIDKEGRIIENNCRDMEIVIKNIEKHLKE
jgi:thiol-disulfide isomerase/thioredoxin